MKQEKIKSQNIVSSKQEVKNEVSSENNIVTQIYIDQNILKSQKKRCETPNLVI